MRLQTKILLITSSLVFILGVPLLWTVKNIVHRILLESVVHRGTLLVHDLAEKAVVGIQQNSEALLFPLLQLAQESSGAAYVMVIDLTGQVIAHTNVAEKGKIYRDLRTQVALKAKEPYIQTIPLAEGEVVDISIPIWSSPQTSSAEDFLLLGSTEETQKKRLGIIRLALPLKETKDIEFRLFRRIAWINLTAGGIGFLLILFFMRSMLRSIPLLSHAASRIGRGEYGTLVPLFSRDELGQLSADFNRMSKALAETTVSKDFMSGILSHMLDPLFVVDKNGNLQMLNQAALQLLGYSESELLGKSAALIFLETRPLGPAKNVEINFLTKDKVGVPVLYSSSPLKNSAGQMTGLIGVARDMTERKRMEAIIRQSEKMSAVGQLAAGVAHEINNPLGVILGFSQAVVRRLKADDPLEMPLKSIEKEAIRCKNLVQDLLTFSRISNIEREPVDLNRAVEGAFSLVAAQARIASVEVRKELGVGLPRIFGNHNQIQQIIINLANNAIDAMENKGVLTVKTSSLIEGPLSWVCLKISDTGAGIPPEIISKIFDPFFTTKGVGKGTGLGLSLVHEIIKKHSGTTDVQSRPGFTEFCIKFPVRAVGIAQAAPGVKP